MSLIQEINRTETNKNKTKQVATNIDNKLIELGGEQATDLTDVPNKMEVMVKTQYKRVAIIKPNKTMNPVIWSDHGKEWRKWSLSLNFTPSLVIVIGQENSFQKHPTIVSSRDTESSSSHWQSMEYDHSIAIRNITKDGFEYRFTHYASGGLSMIVKQIICIE